MMPDKLTRRGIDDQMEQDRQFSGGQRADFEAIDSTIYFLAICCQSGDFCDKTIFDHWAFQAALTRVSLNNTFLMTI